MRKVAASWNAWLACAGALFAGVAGFGAFLFADEQRCKARYRSCVRASDEGLSSHEALAFGARSKGGSGEGLLDAAAMSWAIEQSRRLSLGHATRLVPRRLMRAEWFERHAAVAGLSGQVTLAGFWETRVRAAGLGCACGFAAGLLVSGELAALLAVVGFVFGWRLLPRAIDRRVAWRAHEMERHLPEMLDVVALGMRSGLSFDHSLTLYVQHFDTMLAQAFSLAQRQWSHGLVSREEALRRIAASYDSALLARVTESIVRSLRFGSSMAEGLESAAREARVSYRARKQEQVAKAPVKMMVPTGTLILPAMLILVLGPVLLELAGGF